MLLMTREAIVPNPLTPVDVVDGDRAALDRSPPSSVTNRATLVFQALTTFKMPSLSSRADTSTSRMVPLMVSVPSSAKRFDAPSKSMSVLIVPKPWSACPGVRAKQPGAVDRAAGDAYWGRSRHAAGEPQRLTRRVDVHDSRDVEPRRRPHVTGDVHRAIDVHVATGQQRRLGVVVHQIHHAGAIERPLSVGIVEIHRQHARADAVVDVERVDAASAVDAAEVLHRLAALIVSGASILMKSPTVSEPSKSTSPPTMLSVTASLTLTPPN